MSISAQPATIKDLLSALGDYIEAKTEHDAAAKVYHAGGGYSWDYFGAKYNEKVSKAESEIENALIDIIDARATVVVRKLVQRN